MSSPLPSAGSRKQSRVSESVFTTLLLSPPALERRLAPLAVEGMSWRRTGDGERNVYVLEGGDRRSRNGVVEALLEDFGPLLVRPGDVDPVAGLLRDFRSAGLTIAAAESCTGGLLSKILTDVPGSSDVFWGSVVSYANAAKTGLLGVPEPLLSRCGAVSRETVRAMAEGVINVSGADCAVSVSGVAGPGGGSPEKPVGTVWIGVGGVSRGFLEQRFLFPGSRRRVRTLSAYIGLFLLQAFILRGESIDTRRFDEYI